MLQSFTARVSGLPTQRIVTPSNVARTARTSTAAGINGHSRMATAHKNVLGGELQPCADGCGFQRNGYCAVTDGDFGVHAVAAIVTEEFLTYTKGQGNDLSTPRPPTFPGLQAGDRWCLCASRWLQAEKAGKAPKVVLEATDAAALETIPLDLLQQYSA